MQFDNTLRVYEITVMKEEEEDKNIWWKQQKMHPEATIFSI